MWKRGFDQFGRPLGMPGTYRGRPGTPPPNRGASLGMPGFPGLPIGPGAAYGPRGSARTPGFAKLSSGAGGSPVDVNWPDGRYTQLAELSATGVAWNPPDSGQTRSIPWGDPLRTFTVIHGGKSRATHGSYGTTAQEYQAMQKRDVAGSGGYVYRQFENGDIYILSGPADVHKMLPAMSSTQWVAITKEIGPVASQKSQVDLMADPRRTSKTSATGASSIDWTTGQITQKKAGLFSNILAAIGGGDPQAGAKTALELTPTAVSAVSQTVQGLTTSEAALARRLATAKGKYAKARAKGDNAGAARWAAKVKQLQAQLEATQAYNASAGSMDTGLLPSTTTGEAIPWVPIAIGGGVILLVLAVAMSRNSA